MKTLEQLKAEAAERGIVEGAVIRSAHDPTYTATVNPPHKWSLSVRGDMLLNGYSVEGSDRALWDGGKWAEVITPAPSKEEGLKEGDACEGSAAMRVAIVELAKELGLKHSSGISTGIVVYTLGTVNDVSIHSISGGRARNKITPEAFIAKMRVEAAKPKPIMIESEGNGYSVAFQTGSIKVGFTTIDNATVRAIASKLID